MRLHHLHLKTPIPYTHSLHLQETLLTRHFASKDALRSTDALTRSSAPAVPPPTLLTFQTQPTYTVGRRHLTANPLSEAQIAILRGHVSPHQHGGDIDSSNETNTDLATFFPSPRGGLLTYHAPGQLTGYLVLDLRTHKITPRCYIRTLEETIIRTCRGHGVPRLMTTEDPGVWVAEAGSGASADDTVAHDTGAHLTPTNRKICAIGVQVTRGITTHGLGLNVFDAPIDPASHLRSMYTMPAKNIYTSEAAASRGLSDSEVPVPGYLSWGFSRIIACGLEGKSVTWLSREQQSASELQTPKLEDVANTLAVEVARSLDISEDCIDEISELDVTGGM